MMTEPGVYEERFLWSRATGTTVAAGAVAVMLALGVRMPALPTLVLLVAGLAGLAWGLACRRVALRVDSAGVTLGGSLPRFRATAMAVPWADIVAVVLWRQLLSAGEMTLCLGLKRREGAQAAPAADVRDRAAASGGLVPDVPSDVMAASRAVRGWRLDRQDLVRAVAEFAPGVIVVDADTGEILGGDDA